MKKVVNRGLNTIDETKANAICNDALALFSMLTIRQEKPSPKFQGDERPAGKLSSKKNSRGRFFDISEKGFTRDDIVQIAELRENHQELAALGMAGFTDLKIARQCHRFLRLIIHFNREPLPCDTSRGAIDFDFKIENTGLQ